MNSKNECLEEVTTGKAEVAASAGMMRAYASAADCGRDAAWLVAQDSARS